MYRSFYRVLVALAAVGLLVAVTATVAFAQGQGRVTGTVTDAAGLPLAGAVVKAENPNARPPVFEQKTGNNGRYAMIGLMSGPWTFTASYEGYRPNAGPVKVRAGENPPVNFSLERILHPLEIALGEEALKGLDPKAIEQELAGADAAFNAQQWDKAIAGYQAILQKLPALTNLNLNIGNAYRANGDNKSALASYEAVLKGDPGNEQAKTEIARTKLAMGDLSGAAELQKSASGLDASREDLYNLGELEFAKGQVDAAKAWYEKATMADPKWGKPLFKLALVALNKGDIPGAKKYFQQVLDVDANSPEGQQAKQTLAALP